MIEDTLQIVDLSVDVLFGNAEVRFVATSVKPIGVSDLRSEHLDRLVRISGQISQATPVRPRIITAAF